MLPHAKRLPTRSTDSEISGPRTIYTLYTDASKYAYAGVLTQRQDDTDHPVAYVSGLFRGSQLNWAALTKEAYAIYMSVKKLSFYLDSARITVRSDHLPLKRFLEKNTLNAKVNNWAVELESQKIDFVFIQGTNNVLADTLSRLIEIDDDIKLPAEQERHEFGYVPFEKLPPAQVTVTEEVIINEVNNLKIKIQHIDPVQKDLKIELPISNLKLKELQEQDRKINHLRKLWSENKLNKNIFAMENDILKKKVIECGLLYKPVIIPEILRECLLILAHDEQGHNGFKRTHSALKTLYYWKGMKRHIQLYCRRCRTCTLHNVQNPGTSKGTLLSTTTTNGIHCHGPHWRIPPRHPVKETGTHSQPVCMLTGFTFCIPLKSKRAEDVVTAYLNHICCIFGPSKKILTDNGSDF